MNKILIHAISDTHNRHDKIKGLTGGDLLIHAGDFSSLGQEWEAERFLKWMSKQRYPAKVLICGNHEVNIEREYYIRFKQMCKEAGIILLDDSSVTLQFVPGIVYIDQDIPDLPKFRIHGSPITPWFYGHNWGWNRARNDSEAALYKCGLIKPHWDIIPEDTDILVTHGPPYEILDELVFPDGTPKGQFVGCVELGKRIQEIKPDIHVFGHIHCAHGQKHVNGTSHYNVSMCDEMYLCSNPITVIEYEKENEPNKENNVSKDKSQPK